MYSTKGNGLAREIERLNHHRKEMFYILNHPPADADIRCAVSQYVKAYISSPLHEAIAREGVSLCDRFGMKLCNGHCLCNGHK